MNADTGLDNAIPGLGREIPCMMSNTDISIVRKAIAKLPKNATIIEFGPWLGGVSTVLARSGNLHVVDRFIWTEKNAERVPGVSNPGSSFLPVFEKNMRTHGVEAKIHSVDFLEFEWSGGPIDLCFIDAPRKPVDLLACLMPIAKSLHQDTILLIKNGLNPLYFEMMSLIEVFLAQSIFDLVPVDQAKWCNIACLKSGAKLARIYDVKFDDDFFDRNPFNPEIKDPWGGSTFPIARVAQHVAKLQWESAYDQLDRLTPDIANIYHWDEQAPHLKLPGTETVKLSAFAEQVSFHNDPARASKIRIPFEKSPALALRSYWKRHSAKPWRSRFIDPKLVERAFQQGYLRWPAKLESHVQHRTVLEFGSGLAFSGIGYSIAGATSYIGIDIQANLDPAQENLAVDQTGSLPVWLTVALNGQDHAYRVVHFGEPVQQIDLCLVHDGDPVAKDILNSIANVWSSNAPQIEHILISDEHGQAVVSAAGS